MANGHNAAAAKRSGLTQALGFGQVHLGKSKSKSFGPSPKPKSLGSESKPAPSSTCRCLCSRALVAQAAGSRNIASHRRSSCSMRKPRLAFLCVATVWYAPGTTHARRQLLMHIGAKPNNSFNATPLRGAAGSTQRTLSHRRRSVGAR